MTPTLAAGERAVTQRLLARAEEIGRSEMAGLLGANPRSAALYERADPHPAVRGGLFLPEDAALSHLPDARKGSHVWDQDGTEYLDFHCGFGAMVAGHAHPRIVEAIHEAASRGDPLRRDDRIGGGVRRRDLPAVRPRDGPLRQLRHRSDDGRDPGGPRRDRPGRGVQDRRLVSRPPRQRDVLGRPQRRRHGRTGASRKRAVLQGDGEGRVEVHRGRAVQRRRTTSSGVPKRAGRSPASSWSRP